MPTATVVIPTFNERENLPELVHAILQCENKFRILVVDDNSPDGTGKIADELAARFDSITVLHRSDKNGLGSAYVCGFQYALQQSPDYILSMDCDLSHDPSYLPAILEALKAHDVVIGSRYLNGVSVVNWPIGRLILSCLGNIYAKQMTGLRVQDCTSGYVGYRGEALKRIILERILSDGYAFMIELKYRCHQMGFSMIEIPIVFTERHTGVSKLACSDFLEAFFLPWRLQLDKIQKRIQEFFSSMRVRK